jgi:AcrR family transcriptional regulator
MTARPDLLAGEQLPPAPQQARSRRKREALLESALALFGEQGYETTSIEQIAQRAGVAVGAFYQHFATKRQLVLVLMNQLLDEITILITQAQQTPPSSDIRAVIATLVRDGLFTDWHYAGAYRAWRATAHHDPALAALNDQLEAWTASQLELIFGTLLQAPGARSDVDLPTFAHLMNMLFWRLIEARPADHDASERLVAALTNLIAHALFIERA